MALEDARSVKWHHKEKLRQMARHHRDEMRGEVYLHQRQMDRMKWMNKGKLARCSIMHRRECQAIKEIQLMGTEDARSRSAMVVPSPQEEAVAVAVVELNDEAAALSQPSLQRQSQPSLPRQSQPSLPRYLPASGPELQKLWRLSKLAGRYPGDQSALEALGSLCWFHVDIHDYMVAEAHGKIKKRDRQLNGLKAQLGNLYRQIPRQRWV